MWRSPRQAIPLDLTLLWKFPFQLYYLEAVNPTDSDIVLTVQDQAGLAGPVQQIVSSQKLLTYESKYGTPMNGLAWKASASGLVGWICGDNKDEVHP